VKRNRLQRARCTPRSINRGAARQTSTVAKQKAVGVERRHATEVQVLHARAGRKPAPTYLVDHAVQRQALVHRVGHLVSHLVGHHGSPTAGRCRPDRQGQPAPAVRVSGCMECHVVTGTFDNCLLGSTRDRDTFNKLHAEQLLHLPGVRQIRSFRVLKQVLSTTRFPI
jgi:DNA-binding Lrp family transcriptional regulator